MIAHARAELPNECCGLLAGRTESRAKRLGCIEKLYPLVNAAHSPVRYLSEEKGLFAAHRDMRALGIEVLAIYHSHPSSPPVPSRTDLAENYWPGVVNFIISLLGPEPEVRGWHLEEDSFSEAEWQLSDSNEKPN